MNTKQVEITGIKELRAEIENIVPKLGILKTSKIAVDMIKDNIEPFSKTKKLYNSIKYKVRRGSNNKFISVITSSVVYSRIQDQGGRITITDKMRRKMWQLFKKTNNPMFKYIAITKNNSIIIPAKHYTKINKRVLVRLAQIEIDKKLKRKKY